MPPADPRNATRERLLDAVEHLFLQHGFDGTSSRMITAEAGANLAAVNYHFGGKDGLFQAMLTRRLDALHAERLRLLEHYESAAGSARLSCDRILTALFIPALTLARDPARGGSDFLRLLGRAYVDPAPPLRTFLSERYAPTIARFKDAFAAALPHIERQELSWRLHFMMGALAYTLAGADAWKLIAALNPVRSGNDELLLRRLAPFLIAGLQAPLPDLAGGELGTAAGAPATTAPSKAKKTAARRPRAARLDPGVAP